jgi:endonuclease/exonuclease/phosphatase (EEP) superfamily protein YafD
VVRIALEGLVLELLGQKSFQFVHENVQWAIMLVAMCLLWGEMQLLWKLLVEPPQEVLSLPDSSSLTKGGPVEVGS